MILKPQHHSCFPRRRRARSLNGGASMEGEEPRRRGRSLDGGGGALTKGGVLMGEAPGLD